MASKKKKPNKSTKKTDEVRGTKKRMTLKERLKLWLFLGWVAFLAVVVIGFFVIKEFNIQDRKVEGRNLAVHDTLDEATLEIWDQSQLEAVQDKIVWCMETADGSHVGRSGSMNGNAQKDVFRVLCNGYGPDVYPTHERNSGKSWEPKDPDNGQEWVIAKWNRRGYSNILEPVRAKAIVIVETYNPGAVVAVDTIENYFAEDGNKTLQGAMKKTRVWAGAMEAAKESRVSVLRLLLNTKQVPDYNSIDTVGLLY